MCVCGGAVRDEGEHARESKADGEKSREMQECSVDGQACPQQPCRGAESRRRRGPVCPLHQRIYNNTVCVWVYIKFLGTAKLQTWIRGLGLNAATDSF